ncbi:MAG: hypothetical protein ABWX65_03245 [Mycetocola sp.]
MSPCSLPPACSRTILRSRVAAERLLDWYPGIRVILPTPDGIVSVLASELLPLSFDYRAEQG